MYNPFTLQGKTVLVTGASSGIGKATAVECSRLGATVIATGRNEDRLNQTLSELAGEGHSAIIADLATDEGIDIIVSHCPQLDGLVNNAGGTLMLPTQFVTRKKLMSVLEVNTIAPILLTQKLIKTKKLGKGTSIVFTDSISGVEIASPGDVLYSYDKHYNLLGAIIYVGNSQVVYTTSYLNKGVIMSTLNSLSYELLYDYRRLW